MHIGEIDTNIVLDLAFPIAALTVSKVLLSLASDIPALRDSLARVAPRIVDETQSGCLSWRIDTCATQEELSVDPIVSWIETISDVMHNASPPAPPTDPQSDCKAMSRNKFDQSEKSLTISSVPYVLSLSHVFAYQPNI